MWTRPDKGESAGKRRKQHVDSPTGKSKPVSSTAPDIIQKNVRSWETLELSTLILGLLRTTVSSPYPGKINRQQENNTIVNNAVDEIILNETQKVCATNYEAPEFMDSYYYANSFQQGDKMSLEETTEKLDRRKLVFEYKKKSNIGLKIEMI